MKWNHSFQSFTCLTEISGTQALDVGTYYEILKKTFFKKIMEEKLLTFIRNIMILK